MKLPFLPVLFALLSLAAANAHAASCIPSPENPGGCMGIPKLNHADEPGAVHLLGEPGSTANVEPAGANDVELEKATD